MKNRALLEHMTVVANRHKVLMDAAILIKDDKIEDIYMNRYEKRLSDDIKRIDCSGLIAMPAYVDKIEGAIMPFIYQTYLDVANPGDESLMYLNHNLAVKLDVFKFDRAYLAFVLKNLYQSQVILDPDEHDIPSQMAYLHSLSFSLCDIAAYSSLNYLEYQNKDQLVGNLQKGKEASFDLYNKDLKLITKIRKGKIHA